MDTFLSPLALTIFFLLAEAVSGVAFGWWLRGGIRLGPDDAEARRDAEHARESLERVRTLTETVAKNVGEHKTRVQEISDEISAKTGDSGGEDSGDDILASISQLVEANGKMHEQLAQAEDRMKEQAEEIESHATIARTDALTEIDNRRAFDDDLQQCVSHWSRLNTPFSLLLFDVDHFKNFNDTHGHQAGDEVLKGVARAIKGSLRDVDLVSRYGGEEFTVILPGTKSKAAKVAAEKARSAIESSVFRCQNTELRVTASLGLAQVLKDEDGESLVKRADTALYLAKEHSRNCSFYHDGQQGYLVEELEESTDDTEAPPTETVLLEEDSADVVEAAARASDPSIAGDVPADEEPLPPRPQPSDKTPELEASRRLDAQTGLPDRDALLEDTTRRIAEWRRYESPLSAISIVIDDYDRRIEECGASARDLMLKIVTQFLQATLRDMDVVARCDENLFTILLPGTTMEHAVDVAGRLRVAISRCAVQLAGSPLEITVSLGVAAATIDDEAESLIGRSASAAARAAETGGNATCAHDGEHCERVDVELETAE